MKNILFLLSLYTSLLTAQPTIQWQKTFGGSYVDEPSGILQTSDGGYILSGITGSSNGDVFGHHGGFDIWILKLGNTGAIQWKRILGGTGTDVSYSMIRTFDGGYFFCGYTSSNNFDVSGNHGGNYDGWAVKLSSTGTIEWQKAMGGSGWDDFWSVRQTADHGYILVGKAVSTDGDVPENHGTFDVWVVKLDESGNMQWSKIFGGSGEDYGKSVTQTDDGGYLVVGETASMDGDVTEHHGNIDLWVLKLSAIGALEWQKTYGGIAWDTASGVLKAEDGGYVVIGYTGSNNGDVTGHHGSFDFWVLKISSNGDLEWQRALGGSGPDRARNIVTAIDGGYVIVGDTESSNGDVIGNNGGAEFWLVKLSQTGELLWQQTYGGTKAEAGFAIDKTADNGFILTGYAWSTDGDLTGSPNKGYNDYWIVKLSPESISTTKTPDAKSSSLEIYPNPALQSISIRAATDTLTLNISVSDLLGRELLRRELPNGGQIDIESLTSGLYIIHGATSDGKVFNGRFEKG